MGPARANKATQRSVSFHQSQKRQEAYRMTSVLAATRHSAQSLGVTCANGPRCQCG